MERMRLESMDDFRVVFKVLDDRTLDMQNRIKRIDETVCKSANSINVIVRLLAGAQDISGDALTQILIDANALTSTVESTTDIKPEDISPEDLDIMKSQLDYSALTIDEKKNYIPSTSATTSMIPETSYIQNSINQDQSSTSDVSIHNECGNSFPIPAPSVNSKEARQKELKEQEFLRKKYRKWLYSNKYKNINKPNTTQNKIKNVNNPSSTQDEVNVNIPSSSQKGVNNGDELNTAPNSFNDCELYRNPIFLGVENVEIIQVRDEYSSPKHIIRPLHDIQPRVLINKIDSNSPFIQARLKKTILNTENKHQSAPPKKRVKKRSNFK